MDIIFQRQANEDYALAACIQMLTNTEQSQQDIYFKSLRLMQNFKKTDYISKAIFHTPDGPVVGHKEKICKLLEELLNHFKSDDIFWYVNIIRKFDKTPAIAILHKKHANNMVRGHAVVVSKIEKDKIEIYDPANDDPIFSLKMRMDPIISSYFSLERVDTQGTTIDI